MEIRGLLLDLEGVLYQGETPIPGARDAVARLTEAGLGLSFLTNTTTLPRDAIAARLAAMGFAIESSQVFTPPLAARRLLEAAGIRRIHLAAAPGLAADFAGFEQDEAAVEAVVLGDLHRAFDWGLLDRLFGMIRDGARLVALHKNRYCRRDGRIALDLGPFVAALEYAAGIEAEVVGKPAPAFFDMALAELGLRPGEVLMVGDDIEADIGGAAAAGLRTVQVETGKFTEADLCHPRVRPDRRAPSVRELPAIVAALRAGA